MKIIVVACIFTLGFSMQWKQQETEYEKLQQQLDKALYKKGERLFMNDCKACHHPGMVLRSTAPPLGGVTSRYEKKWLYKFTRNSYKMYLRGDTLAVKLLKDNNMSVMTSFTKMSNEELDAIYYFIEERYKENEK